MESWSNRSRLLRTLRYFQKNRYHVVRVDEWEETGPNQDLKFVRTLDLKDFDQE